MAINRGDRVMWLGRGKSKTRTLGTVIAVINDTCYRVKWNGDDNMTDASTVFNTDVRKVFIPEVGEPATICYYSDCEPATISWVSESGKSVRVRIDNWKVVAGSEADGSAKYEYTENPEGVELAFSLRRNGRWVALGQTAKNGTRLSIGNRRRYSDPSF